MSEKIGFKVLLSLVLVSYSCQQDQNVADCEEGRKEIPCSEKTADEKAHIALSSKEYETAIEIYLELVEAEPEEYGRYTLLAAAYAGKAKLSIIDLVTTADFSGADSLIDGMTAFLPSPDDFNTEALYGTAVGDMNRSVESLQVIPSSLLATTSDETYAPSALFQLTLYQSAYSVMFMNQFLVGSAGQFDPSRLEDMTEEDALEILTNLAQAAELQGGESNPELQTKINAALADINSQEGGNSSEKLKEFIIKEQTGEEQ